MKKGVLFVVILLASIIANAQSRFIINPSISIDSLLSKCFNIDPRINEKNFFINDSISYIVEAKVFNFSSKVTKDSVLKKMASEGFCPGNFIEAIIIVSSGDTSLLFPLIFFNANFKSITSDNDFVLYIDKDVWGCEISVTPQYWGKEWKPTYNFLGVKIIEEEIQGKFIKEINQTINKQTKNN